MNETSQTGAVAVLDAPEHEAFDLLDPFDIDFTAAADADGCEFGTP